MKTTLPEYEQSLLGCVMMDNSILEEFPITASLFTDPNNSKVFDAIQIIKARGAIADLREVGLLVPDMAWYAATLTSLANQSNASFYHSQLSEGARKRGIMKMARIIGGMVESDESGEIFEYIDREMCALSLMSEPGYKPIRAFCAQAIAEIESAYKLKGRLTGIPTGFYGLDEKTDGLQKQEFIVIGARPATGKTSIALNMASAAIKDGKKVGIFSVEMRGSAIVKRILSDWAQINMRKMKTGLMSKMEYASLMNACEKAATSKIFINETACISLRDLITDARRMKRKEGIDVLFIDYLSLISNEQKNIPRHEQVADISKNMKKLARELDIPVVVLSQLTREAQTGRPNISQIRDSGAVEQDADIIALLWPQGWTDDTKEFLKITFCLDKNRNGVVGDIDMIFRPAMMHFSEEAK